ncbi:histone-lysine N-methyltransferase SETMAR [Trichonephila clavipes]|nr:histone-lysine N-methyltransferase SETMAR [Trichonephila clavipes]
MIDPSLAWQLEGDNLYPTLMQCPPMVHPKSVYFCVEFLEVGTINATRHCDTLSKLKDVIRKNGLGCLKSDVLLLDDNARSHSATAGQNHISNLGWERLHHPPYSPNLAPSDFHLFSAV